MKKQTKNKLFHKWLMNIECFMNFTIRVTGDSRVTTVDQ